MKFILRWVSIILFACVVGTLSAAVTPVRYYRLGDGDWPLGNSGAASTGFAVDAIAGNNVTFTNGAQITNDVSVFAKSGDSIAFAGTGRGTAAVLSLTSNFCVEAWVKPTNVIANQTILYNGNVSLPDGWGLALRSGNFVGLVNGSTTVGSSSATVNQWTHLALVCSNNTARFFVNGNLLNSGSVVPVSPTLNFFLGGSSTETFSGLIDEVRVSTFTPGNLAPLDFLYTVVPIVLTTTYTNLTTTNVVATAAVNPMTNATTAWFEWGAGDRFDQVTTATNVGSGSLSVNILAALTNLVSGIPYQYRVVASNVYGISRGYPIRLWTTPLTLTAGSALTNECHFPFEEPGVEAPVVGFAGGFGSSVALKSDGTVSAWGANLYELRPIPDLSSPDGRKKGVKLASGYFHTLALLADGTVTGWGENEYGQLNVPKDATNIIDIAAGGYHSVGLRADGKVVAWGVHSLIYGAGGTDFGQADVPANATNIIAIAAGQYHTLAIQSNGNVIAWGQNTYGQTSVPPSATNITAVAAGSQHSLALRNDGRIVAWGSGTGTNVSVSATNVIAIAARLDSSPSVCLRSNGTIVAWGGAGTPSPNTNFVAITQGLQGCGLRKDGSLAVWSVNLPIPAEATNVVQLTAGPYQTLGLRADGSIVSIYFNNSGNATVVPLSATNIIAISGGRSLDYTMALRSNGTAIGWGASSATNVPASATNLVALTAGVQTVYGLRSNGTIVVWGLNSGGSFNIPTNSTSSNFVALAAGNLDGFALRSDGIVVGWGYNLSGQVNVPAAATNVIAIAAGYSHAVALRSDRTVIAWGDGTTSGITNVPPSATNVIAIAAGAYFTLALRGDGTIVGWGYDNFGNASAPAGATNIVAIGAGAYHSAALRADGKLFVWGYDHAGQTDIPSDITKLAQVSYSGVVDTNTPGTYILGYSITNMFGDIETNSRTVTIVDRTPPAISLTGNNPLIQPLNIAFSDPGATATDLCGGNFAVTQSGSVNTSALGTYLRTYVATDNYGNSTTNTRTVVVSSAPSVSGLGASILSTNGGTGLRTVQLSSLVNPNGPATTVTFEYGLTTGYGGSTVVNLPAGFANTNLSVTILANFGATYHWRVSAVHSVGSLTSADQVITIASPYAAGDLNGDGIVTAAELSSVYSNYLPTSPWLAMTNVAGLGGSNVTFSLANFTNENYSVEFSTNLVNWYSLGAATPQFGFTDTNAPANPQRYYRLHYP